MRQAHRAAGRVLLAFAVILGTAGVSSAQDKPGWYGNLDLSFVLTAGNTSTSTLGATADITRNWLRNSWKTTGSFIRVDASEPTRRAVGTTVSNAVLEKGPSVTKSEKLFGNTDFRHRVTERFYWDIGGSLERDRFAGLDLRAIGVAGVGYMFANKTDSSFAAGVGATYTSQSEVIDDPNTENSFAGIRATLDGQRGFGERKQNTFASQFILDENLQETDDLRFNWNNTLAFSISTHLDVKIGAQFTYDNLPQLVEFPVFLRVGNNLVETQSRINGPAEKFDTALTVSFTLKFAPGGPMSRPGR